MAVLIFVLGAVLGSFYLVIATRLPKGEDILISRSRCDNCKKELKWYNLIPIFSYIFQKGKCVYCHKKISPLHIIVELITGVLFLICYLLYGINYDFFAGLIVISLTIIIYISDFKYMVILDSPLVIAIIGIIILKLIYFGINSILLSVFSGFCLFLIMILIQKLGEFMFKKDALGGGDIKFAFVIGLILDFELGLVAIILSTFLALPYSVASLYLLKNNEVPYGPFLAGALLMVFYTMDKFQILVDVLTSF